MIANFANNVHIQAPMHNVPYFLMRSGCKKQMRQMMPRKYFSDEESNAGAEYYALMTQRYGNVEVVCQRMLKYFAFCENSIFTPERILQDFDFPIATVNGTRDFFGSAEGADRVIKNNRFHASGQSQIFKLHNSGHNVFLDNPPALTDYMIGFFNGTVTHTFDLKPRREFVPDQPDH